MGRLHEEWHEERRARGEVVGPLPVPASSASIARQLELGWPELGTPTFDDEVGLTPDGIERARAAYLDGVPWEYVWAMAVSPRRRAGGSRGGG